MVIRPNPVSRITLGRRRIANSSKAGVIFLILCVQVKWQVAGKAQCLPLLLCFEHLRRGLVVLGPFAQNVYAQFKIVFAALVKIPAKRIQRPAKGGFMAKRQVALFLLNRDKAIKNSVSLGRELLFLGLD